jgi:oxaloacetate decarboxylase beta subunit
MYDLFYQFLINTGYYLADYRHIIMIIVGCIFLYLGTAKKYEPLLLVPIGFGILVGNVPFFQGFGIGIYEDNSVLHYLYFGVRTGVYPSIVFLGLGAMTDFSSLLANPKLMLLGAAAQMGIYFTLLGALFFGFLPKEAASIAIIGGADGPTSIFLTAKLAPHLIGHWPHCHCSLFLHGPDSGYPTADHETADLERRAPDTNASRPGSVEKRAYHISGGGSFAVLLSGTDRLAAAGNAVSR